MTVSIAMPKIIPTGGNMKRYLSTAEVARRLSVTSRTVVRWIHEGHFPDAFQANPTVPNSPFLIPVVSVEKFEQARIDNDADNENKRVA